MKLDPLLQAILASVVAAPLTACMTDTFDDGTGSSSGTSGTSASSAEAERVFGLQGNTVNTSQILGVWEELPETRSADIVARARFEFRADSIVAATYCVQDNTGASAYVGGRVRGAVSASLIKIEEGVRQSKPVGGRAQCSVQLSAGNLPACAPATPPASRASCFAIADGLLTFHLPAGVQTLRKVAD